MRMWNLDTKILCKNHLLGEHKEIHMLVGSIQKGRSIKGFIEKGLVEIHNIYERHDELVCEMQRRGYKHSSPLKQIKTWKEGSVDKKNSFKDLMERCPHCRERALNLIEKTELIYKVIFQQKKQIQINNKSNKSIKKIVQVFSKNVGFEMNLTD